MRGPIAILLLASLVESVAQDPIRWDTDTFTMTVTGETSREFTFEGENTSGKKQVVKGIRSGFCTKVDVTNREVKPGEWIAVHGTLNFPSFPGDRQEIVGIEWETGEKSDLTIEIKGPEQPNTDETFIEWVGTLEEKEIVTRGQGRITKATATRGWQAEIRDGRVFVKPTRPKIRGLISLEWETELNGGTAKTIRTIHLEAWEN